MTVFPTGDFADEVNNVGTSFAPVVRVGYEKLYGNFGVSGGGQVAFVYFLSDHDSSDAAWSLETHGYVRGALHAGKVAPYAGLSLGLDTNYNYYDGLGGGDSFTRVGIGLDLDFGVDVAVTPNAQLGIGGTFRPGVNKPAVPDDVPDEAVDDISYFGLRLGATLAF